MLPRDLTVTWQCCIQDCIKAWFVWTYSSKLEQSRNEKRSLSFSKRERHTLQYRL